MYGKIRYRMLGVINTVRRYLSIVLAFFVCVSFGVSAVAWSNGGYTYGDYVMYGTHDMIANTAYYIVRAYEPEAVSYISAVDKWRDFLYYTEWPDMGPTELGYPDWENHNYDFHDYGYCGAEPDRGAPSKVEELYWQAVENISLWQKSGSEEYAKNAAKLMGLLAHYFGDMTMPMHTDDTSDGSPEHTEATLLFPDGKTKEDSYHSLYEKAVDWGVKTNSSDNITNVIYDITHGYQPQHIDDIEQFVIETAMRSNGYPDEVSATDPERSTVGARYWRSVEKVRECVDEGLSYKGIPGMDEELYDETLDLLTMAVGGFTDILYSAWLDASEM